MRPFEIALIGFFGIAAIGALFFFSSHKPDVKPTDVAFGEKVVIWGTFNKLEMDTFFEELSNNNKSFRAVTYKQLDKRAFGETLVNAIAEGKGPDIVLIPNSLLVTYRSKLFPIPFEEFSKRTFDDTYIDGAEIFLRSDGVYGVPIGVDPLILYWNRDILSSSGISTPPKTWETLIGETTRAINKFDSSSNFTQNAIALGQYSNVTNAKNILAMLFFQVGSEIVTETDSSYKVNLDEVVDEGLSPGVAALSFYSQFSSPSKDAYSWNRAKSNDRAEFIGGKLAFYLGMGSEQAQLERDNANLNYDVAVVPQGSGATIHRTYGDFYALSILRSSKNINGAKAAAYFLSETPQAKKISEMYSLSPVRRSLLAENQTDPFKSIMNQSALIAEGWLDPDPQESSYVFRKMIEDAQLRDAQLQLVVRDAMERLRSLF